MDLPLSFTTTQLNYSTLERELTALRWGVKTFRPFLYGIEFTIYTDHQPLVHLNNMRLVCSRLARTFEELSDFSFQIYYTPGHLNSAADALSRLKSQIPTYSPCNYCHLPDGLVIEGQPSPGGGDSLFTSLLRVLNKIPEIQLPHDSLHLRELLVDELLVHCQRYKIKLDRRACREFRLMRCRGQLPSLELLLAASYLFRTRIFVYFWTEQPVIYQFAEYPTVVHLQCISGIHFNPLSELRQYQFPDVSTCTLVDSGPALTLNPLKSD